MNFFNRREQRPARSHPIMINILQIIWAITIIVATTVVAYLGVREEN